MAVLQLMPLPATKLPIPPFCLLPQAWLDATKEPKQLYKRSCGAIRSLNSIKHMRQNLQVQPGLMRSRFCTARRSRAGRCNFVMSYNGPQSGSGCHWPLSQNCQARLCRVQTPRLTMSKSQGRTWSSWRRYWAIIFAKRP